MADSIDISSSGVLSQDGYGPWRSRIDALLRLHHLQDVSDDAPIRYRTNSNFGARITERRLASILIRSHVSPALLKQVSTKDLEKPVGLLHELERRTTPFRFMDLPAELRGRVYDFIFEDEPAFTIKPLKKEAPVYPAITRASRQIRLEVLPMFYTRTHFIFDFVDAPVDETKSWEQIYSDRAIAKAVLAWAERIGGSQLKHLRAVDLSLWRYSKLRQTRCVTVSHHKFDHHNGFQVKRSDEKAIRSIAVRARYSAELEATRQMLSLQGEILFLALTQGNGFTNWG